MQAPIEPLERMAPDDEAALEMALLLQDESLPELDLVRGLAARFGKPLWTFLALNRWAATGSTPETGELRILLLQVLQRAAKERSSVWGTDEIQRWLLKLAVEVIHPRGLRFRLRRRLRRLTVWRASRDLRGPHDGPPGSSELQRALTSLGETERMVLALGHWLELKPDEWARLAGLSTAAAIDHFARARSHLLRALGLWQGQINGQTAHTRARRQLVENLQPASLGESSYEFLSDHLQTCERCRAFQKSLKVLDERLSASFSAAAAEAAPPADLAEQLSTILRPSDETKKTGSLARRLHLKEAAWTLLVLALVGGAAGWLNAGTPPGGQPLIAPTPIGVPGGAAAGGQGSQAVSSPGRPRYPPFSGAPALSADGRFLAFTASLDDLVADDRNRRPDIFLYDRETGQIELVSLTSTGEQADDWSDWPSISADGRFIAFASPAANLADNNIQTCSRPGWPRWELAGNCVNIYLRDSTEGETALVTTGLGGQRVFGSSLSPVISADGNWLAFWSYANNLVPDDNELCGAVNCMDLFLYDRIQSQLSRIPIGRDPNLAVGNEQLSLSGDGRFLVFHVLPTDLFASGTESPPAVEVRIYDRDRDEMATIIPTLGEKPAEGATAAPQISADGQLIAFASRSSSLNTLDSDNEVDVFVYNRARGTIDLASLLGSSRYRLGNSGVSPYPPGLWGERLSISADGRFVAYSALIIDSRADTAAGFPARREGKYIIVRDRLAGISRTVFRGLPVGFLYEYPSISADGRWLAFTARPPFCVLACSSTVLVDRSTGATEWLGPSPDELAPPLPAAAGQTVEQWQKLEPLESHVGAVRAIAFSPDGRILATGGDDHTVRLSAPSSPDRPAILGQHEDILRALAFTHDGLYLASGSQDGIVQIWHVPTGRLLDVLSVRPNAVRSLAFSPDGLLAVGSLRYVQIWQFNNEILEPFDRLEFPGEFVDSVSYSPDGHYLAIAPGDHTVWIRDTQSGKIAARLAGHNKIIRRVVFSQDGTLLATGSDDTQVNVWQLETSSSGELILEHRSSFRRDQWVTGLAFFPGSDNLAVSTLDGELALWDTQRMGFVESGLPRERIAALAMALSSDGRSLAVATTAGVMVLQPGKSPAAASQIPRYFVRLEADQFQSIYPMLDSHPLYPNETEAPPPLSEAIKRIQVGSPFELLVPKFLPDGFVYQQIRWPLLDDHTMGMLVYHRSNTSLEFEQLFLFQGLAAGWEAGDSSLFSPGIGASAVVEKVEISGEIGEYVRGNWSTQDSGFLELVFPALYENSVWDPAKISSQLRWQRGDTRYGLLYMTYGIDNPSRALDKSDLIAIASALGRPE